MRFYLLSTLAFLASTLFTSSAAPVTVNPAFDGKFHYHKIFIGPWIVSAHFKGTNTTLPGTYYPQLSYLQDGKVYTGNAKLALASEPFNLHGGNFTHSFSFNSYRQPLTFRQFLYAWPKGAQPLGLTTADSSGTAPKDAITDGFSIDTGNKISVTSGGDFVACPAEGTKIIANETLGKGSYVIYFKAPDVKDLQSVCKGAIAVDLTVSPQCPEALAAAQ